MESSLTSKLPPGIPVQDTGTDSPSDPVFTNGFSRVFEDDESLIVLSQEQRRQRVVAMLERMAPLVARLSGELCKERHGEYMQLSAKIEEAAIIVEANLTELEASLDNDAVQRPGRLIRLLAPFVNRAAEQVRGYAALNRQRDRHLETIRQLRAQLKDLRGRPEQVHAAAVEHVKRLLLYADQRYQAFNLHLTRQATDLDREQNGNYYSKKAEAMRQTVAALKQQMEALNAEFYDKALQQVQESDNGPRPQ